MISDSNKVTIAIPYTDEHLVELSCVVESHEWTGASSAYCSKDVLTGFIDDLRSFADTMNGDAELTIGSENGIGLVGLRFYTIDRAGHIACHVRIASQTQTDHRPEQVCRLLVEVRTDRASVDRFIEESLVLIDRLEGEAVLQCY